MESEIFDLKSILTYKGLVSGYSFRGKIQNVYNGGVRVVQLKDFENNYTSIGDDCFLIDSDKVKSRYYLESGDILFIAKGANNFALVYEGSDDIPTIASSAMFVVKVKRELAIPEYVAWYINQKKAQDYFKINEAGTYVTSVNKKTLEDTPIELPSIEVQKKIAQVAKLHNIEKRLNNRVAELKNKLITTQLLNTI